MKMTHNDMSRMSPVHYDTFCTNSLTKQRLLLV